MKEQLETRLKFYRDGLISNKAKLNLLQSKLVAMSTKIVEIKEFQDISSKVQAFIQKQIESQKKFIKDKISSIISYGITTVFDSDIEFIIKDSEDDQNKIDFRLKRKIGEEWIEEGIVGSSGGGLINLITFLLNVVSILLYKPALRKVLILDESWSNIDSEGRSEKIKLLIEQLAEKTGLQFIISTHKPGLTSCGDMIYKAVKDENGHTSYELVPPNKLEEILV